MPKFCKNCGMVSEENDLFCKSCGTRLDNKYQNAVPAKHTRISVKSCKSTHSAICRIISILSVVELFIMLFVFGYMSNVTITQKPLLALPLQRSILAEVFKGVLYGQKKYWVGFCICLMASFSIIVLSGISGIIGKRNKKLLYISASLNVFLLIILPFMSSGAYFGIGGVKLLLALSRMKAGACCMMLALVFLTIVLQCVVYLDFTMLKASKIRLILGTLICMAILVLPIYYLEDEIEFVRAMKYIGVFCWSKDNAVSYLATIVGIMPILAGVCFCVIPNVFCEKGFAVMRSMIFGAVILIADFLILSDISFITEFIDEYILSVFAVVLLNAAIVWHIYLDLKNRGISVSNEREW